MSFADLCRNNGDVPLYGIFNGYRAWNKRCKKYVSRLIRYNKHNIADEEEALLTILYTLRCRILQELKECEKTLIFQNVEKAWSLEIETNLDDYIDFVEDIKNKATVQKRKDITKESLFNPKFDTDVFTDEKQNMDPFVKIVDINNREWSFWINDRYNKLFKFYDTYYEVGLFQGVKNIKKIFFISYDDLFYRPYGWGDDKNREEELSMGNICKDCVNLEEVVFEENFHTDNMVSMSSAFEGCSSLKRVVGLNNLITQGIDVSRMFMNCHQLEIVEYYLLHEKNTKISQYLSLDNVYKDLYYLPSDLLFLWSDLGSNYFGPQKLQYRDKFYHFNANNMKELLDLQTKNENNSNYYLSRWHELEHIIWPTTYKEFEAHIPITARFYFERAKKEIKNASGKEEREKKLLKGLKKNIDDAIDKLKDNICDRRNNFYIYESGPLPKFRQPTLIYNATKDALSLPDGRKVPRRGFFISYVDNYGVEFPFRFDQKVKYKIPKDKDIETLNTCFFEDKINTFGNEKNEYTCFPSYAFDTESDKKPVKVVLPSIEGMLFKKDLVFEDDNSKCLLWQDKTVASDFSKYWDEQQQKLSNKIKKEQEEEEKLLAEEKKNKELPQKDKEGVLLKNIVNKLTLDNSWDFYKRYCDNKGYIDEKSSGDFYTKYCRLGLVLNLVQQYNRILNMSCADRIFNLVDFLQDFSSWRKEKKEGYIPNDNQKKLSHYDLIFLNMSPTSGEIYFNKNNKHPGANMDFMFYGCDSLYSIDLSKWRLFDSWHTGKNYSTKFMFAKCHNLNYCVAPTYDYYDRDGLWNAEYMFYDCPNLETVVLNPTPNVFTKNMFYGCEKLKILANNKFKVSYKEGYNGFHDDPQYQASQPQLGDNLAGDYSYFMTMAGLCDSSQKIKSNIDPTGFASARDIFNPQWFAAKMANNDFVIGSDSTCLPQERGGFKVEATCIYDELPDEEMQTLREGIYADIKYNYINYVFNMSTMTFYVSDLDSIYANDNEVLYSAFYKNKKLRKLRITPVGGENNMPFEEKLQTKYWNGLVAGCCLLNDFTMYGKTIKQNQTYCNLLFLPQHLEYIKDGDPVHIMFPTSYDFFKDKLLEDRWVVKGFKETYQDGGKDHYVIKPDEWTLLTRRFEKHKLSRRHIYQIYKPIADDIVYNFSIDDFCPNPYRTLLECMPNDSSKGLNYATVDNLKKTLDELNGQDCGLVP